MLLVTVYAVSVLPSSLCIAFDETVEQGMIAGSAYELYRFLAGIERQSPARLEAQPQANIFFQQFLSNLLRQDARIT